MRRSLQRKLGPLQVWQWAALAVIGGLLLSRRNAQQAAAQTQAAGGTQGYDSSPGNGQQGAAAAPTDASSPGTPLDGAGRSQSSPTTVTVNVNGQPTQGQPGAVPTVQPFSTLAAMRATQGGGVSAVGSGDPNQAVGDILGATPWNLYASHYAPGSVQTVGGPARGGAAVGGYNQPMPRYLAANSPSAVSTQAARSASAGAAAIRARFG